MDKAIIETDRLIIRLLNLSDVEMILALLNEPSFLSNIGDKGVRDLEGAKGYINDGPLAMQDSLGFSMYCCERKYDGKTIGLSGLIKRDGVEYPEVGFAFLQQYCRQGYGIESSTAVIKYAQRNLALTKLQAITNQENLASINLLTRIGFCFKKLIILPNSEDEINLFELAL